MSVFMFTFAGIMPFGNLIAGSLAHSHPVQPATAWAPGQATRRPAAPQAVAGGTLAVEPSLAAVWFLALAGTVSPTFNHA